MNISKIEKASQKYIFLAAVIGLTLFAGAKHGSPTNDPPDSTSGDSSPTNDPPAAAPLVQVQSPSPRMELLPLLSSRRPSAISLRSIAPSHFDSITNWTARGAWCDWKRIEFGDSFSFPSGTNLLTGVTLMSYGELRPSLLPNPYSLIPPLSALPQAVSLEPDASSVVYGLTPSNSFVFVWENACVNRDATNRVNAAIELFDSGAIAITTQFGDQPPTTNYQLPTNPPGFIGEGQDSDWAAAAFPNDFAAITNKGYETWLMEDYVGHNEPNGRYKLAVTIAALPEHGPCYLVVGPHRMVVTQPGTYSFPLMDMTEYELYTCPVAVPLTYEFDDGWDPIEPDNYPYMMLASPPMTLGAPNNNHYRIERFPEVFIRPNYLTREQALQELIEIRCNAAGIAARDYTSISGWAIVRFTNAGDAVIEEACRQDDINIYFRIGEKETCGTIHIRPDWWWPWWHDPDSTNDTSNVSSTNGTNSAGTP